ncbi:hypothetical protein KCP75_00420 [Salmonella enterica subsp. enterica]|nr:hypothetical protein KCP75_00420 [Salmonella enterica subsp. enterica]
MANGGLTTGRESLQKRIVAEIILNRWRRQRRSTSPPSRLRRELHLVASGRYLTRTSRRTSRNGETHRPAALPGRKQIKPAGLVTAKIIIGNRHTPASRVTNWRNNPGGSPAEQSYLRAES